MNHKDYTQIDYRVIIKQIRNLVDTTIIFSVIFFLDKNSELRESDSVKVKIMLENSVRVYMHKTIQIYAI